MKKIEFLTVIYMLGMTSTVDETFNHVLGRGITPSNSNWSFFMNTAVTRPFSNNVHYTDLWHLE